MNDIPAFCGALPSGPAALSRPAAEDAPEPPPAPAICPAILQGDDNEQ